MSSLHFARNLPLTHYTCSNDIFSHFHISIPQTHQPPTQLQIRTHTHAWVCATPPPSPPRETHPLSFSRVLAESYWGAFMWAVAEWSLWLPSFRQKTLTADLKENHLVQASPDFLTVCRIPHGLISREMLHFSGFHGNKERGSFVLCSKSDEKMLI